MLEFVDIGLYFVQDENNFLNPLLQVGPDEKSTGSVSGGPKINGSGRIRIPAFLEGSQVSPYLQLVSCHLEHGGVWIRIHFHVLPGSLLLLQRS